MMMKLSCCFHYRESDEEYKLRLLRLFPPFIPNDVITRHERIRLAIGVSALGSVALILFLIIQQTASATWYHVFPLLCEGTLLIRLCCIVYRYIVQWRVAKVSRWNYWHEIQQDVPKLCLLGHYHRYISKYLESFPPGTPEHRIKKYYLLRGGFNTLLFASIYVSIVFYLSLGNSTPLLPGVSFVLFIISLSCTIVLYRVVINYVVELQQVLYLSRRPEFASNESIPLVKSCAMSSTSYNSV